MNATTWYENQTGANVEGRNIGTLAVIAPLLERMKVTDIINQHLSADPQAEYDFGTILSVLIAARMYSPVALMNVGGWAAETGADLMWNIPAEKLNDDRLGKALDKFFAQRHSILASFASRSETSALVAAMPLYVIRAETPRKRRGGTAQGRWR